MKRIALFLSAALVLAMPLRGQVVYQHTDYQSIYIFLDEMANLQHIALNSAVQPYSRQFIAERLNELEAKRDQLNARQQGQLDFFLKDYNKELKRYTQQFDKRFDLFYYADEEFQISVNPILGVTYVPTGDNTFRRWGGAEAFMTFGKSKRWAGYMNFRETFEDTQFTSADFLNQYRGSGLRVDGREGTAEFSEIRGGLTYDWGWGDVGLVQESFEWGSNYNGANIFGERAQVAPQVRMHLRPVKWVDFHYVHAWLNSALVDSSRTIVHATGVREVLRPKYVAANMLTVTPIKHLNVSLGNSTVYSDMAAYPGYWIPFFFYRTVDHNNGGFDNDIGQNGQLFFDVSSRNFKGWHLYATLFIDELKVTEMFDADRQRNQVSMKGGARYAGLLGGDLSLTAEYTRNNPRVYRHYYEGSTFENNTYPLGHYLGENAQEIYLEAQYRPIPKLNVTAYYLNVRKGENFDFTAGAQGSGLPFIETAVFSRQDIGLRAFYEWRNDVYASFDAFYSTVDDETGSYLPEFQQGNNFQFFITVNYGF